MTAAGWFPPPLVNPTTVETDIPCRKCQYNLRSLPLDGRCPECATPVGLSVLGEFLRFSDPSWLHTVRLGITLILGGIVCGILTRISGRIIVGVTGVPFAAMPLQLGTSVLQLMGGWFLTTPDPSGLGEHEYGLSRRIIRVTLIISMAGTVLGFAREFSGISMVLRNFVILSAAILISVGVIGQVATLHYLGKMARRIPDDEIAKRSDFLKYAIAISYGSFIPLGVVFGLRALKRLGSGWMIGIGRSAILGAVAWLIFGVMYLFMLIKLRRRLKEAETSAARTWNKAGVI